MEKNYYKILGVEDNASDDNIIKAYHKLALKYHPDRTKLIPEIAVEKFHLIREAYEVLCDKEKRANFDSIYRAFLDKQKRDEEMDSTRRMFKERLVKAEEKKIRAEKERLSESQQKMQDYLKMLEQAKSGREDDEHAQAIRIELGLSSGVSHSSVSSLSSSSRKGSEYSSTPSSFRTVNVSFFPSSSPFFSSTTYLTQSYLSSLFLTCGLINGVAIAPDKKSALVEFDTLSGAYKCVSSFDGYKIGGSSGYEEGGGRKGKNVRDTQKHTDTSSSFIVIDDKSEDDEEKKEERDMYSRRNLKWDFISQKVKRKRYVDEDKEEREKEEEEEREEGEEEEGKRHHMEVVIDVDKEKKKEEEDTVRMVVKLVENPFLLPTVSVGEDNSFLPRGFGFVNPSIIGLDFDYEGKTLNRLAAFVNYESKNIEN